MLCQEMSDDKMFAKLCLKVKKLLTKVKSISMDKNSSQISHFINNVLFFFLDNQS